MCTLYTLNKPYKLPFMIFSKLVKPTLVGLIACLFAITAQAQNKTITGRVTDSKDGSPLVGASVVVKGTKTGTQTGADGTFRISVPASASTLVISSVGFGTQEVSISSTSNVSLSLTAINTQLNDVVVIGYGTTRKRDVTGSVVSLKAKDFNQGAIASPTQLLQNKVAGLEVTNQNGQPGAAPTIQIRGTTSVRSNNSPLYVVDGVPLDGSTARPNLSTTLGSTPNSDPLLFIDPNSIAQIDVLKDASSAAIYGSRGANGVIVITTKKALSGGMKIEAGINYGFNAGFMKRYEILNAGEFRSALSKYKLGSSLDGGQNVDALKEITQAGFSQNYSLALSGGSENAKYRASILGSQTQGFLKKTELNKYIATVGTTFKALDNRLTLDFNLIAGNYGELLTSVSNTAGSEGNLISSALEWNPTMPFRLASGLYNYPSSGSGNPLAFSEAYNDRSSVNEFLANASIAYKILDNLEYKFLYGVNHGTGSRKLSFDGWITGIAAVSGIGVAGIADASLLSQVFTHTLSYNPNIGKDLTLNAVVGYEYYKRDYTGDGIGEAGFNTNLDYRSRTPILYTSNMQDAKTVSTPYFTYANPTSELQSYFARLRFNYLDRYGLDVSMRADGSSKFGANNKYGYFPAVGLRWNIYNEGFMKDNKLFSSLSLRASYGATGNQEFPAGSSQEQFTLGSYNTPRQSVNGNPDLKWETVKSTNIGLDFSFMKGRIYGSLDYYSRNTSDVLFQTTAIQPAPSSISFVNLPNAILKNTGFEVSLGATVIDHANFGWELTANYAYTKSKITNFTDPLTGLDNLVNTGFINGQGVSGTLAQVITNNQPVNVFYLKPFQGYDAGGNQIIGGTPQFAGDPNPSSLLGFSTTLRYKKFSLNINMGGAMGFVIYNNTATSVTNINGIKGGRNIDRAAYLSAEQPSSGAGASTRFLESGNYFKMRNTTLRYNIGNAGKYIKNMSAFVSGSNLFVLTKFTGFDPEVNIDKSNNSYPSRSIEYVPFPTPRVITFGVNFTL